MFSNCFDVLCNISFREHHPEDGHNMWPKHVAGYAVCNTINLHIRACTCWFFFLIVDQHINMFKC